MKRDVSASISISKKISLSHEADKTNRVRFVLASPSIKLLVEDPIVANPGQTVTLVCIISGGEPNPTLTWVRNGEELPKKSVLNGGTLTIPAISTEEAGVYSCVASNNVGNPAKKSTNIVVRGEKRGLEAELV